MRKVAEENYTSAVAELLEQSEKATDTRERARVLMWLGLSYGTQAIDYPNTGWQFGTTATAYLKQALALDPEVINAPDVARVLAEMVASGWAEEDPTSAVDKYERKAELSRKSVDFFFTGVISRRLSARAWSYSDTTEQGQAHGLGFFEGSSARPAAL